MEHAFIFRRPPCLCPYNTLSLFFIFPTRIWNIYTPRPPESDVGRSQSHTAEGADGTGDSVGTQVSKAIICMLNKGPCQGRSRIRRTQTPKEALMNNVLVNVNRSELLVLLQAGDLPVPADLEGRPRSQVQQCQRQPRDFLCVLDCSRYFQETLNITLQTEWSVSTNYSGFSWRSAVFPFLPHI